MQDDVKHTHLLSTLGKNASPENQLHFLQQVRKARLQRSSIQLESLLEGLGDVLPVELLPLWTPEELELMVCGPIELNVDLLKSVTVSLNL